MPFADSNFLIKIAEFAVSLKDIIIKSFLLGILFNFIDINPITTPEQWSERIFGSSGSVAFYFNEVSEGLLYLVPAQETFGTSNDGIVG